MAADRNKDNKKRNIKMKTKTEEEIEKKKRIITKENKE